MIDAYLKLTTGSAQSKGEAQDSVFDADIELTHFDTGGGSTSRTETDEEMPLAVVFGRSHCPFHFEVGKAVDAVSPYLFKAYCTSYARLYVKTVNLFEKAEVQFRKAGGDAGAQPEAAKSGLVYMTMEFDHVVLVSYALTASDDATETVRFAFRKARVKYDPQTKVGTTGPAKDLKGWDFLKNVPY